MLPPGCCLDAHIPLSDDLKTLAVELQDLVQAKVGTAKFAAGYNDIRQKALSVRRERKASRAIQVRLWLVYCRRSRGAYILGLARCPCLDRYGPHCRSEEEAAAKCGEEG